MLLGEYILFPMSQSAYVYEGMIQEMEINIHLGRCSLDIQFDCLLSQRNIMKMLLEDMEGEKFSRLHIRAILPNLENVLY